MRRLLPGDEGRKEVIDSLLRYVYDESPEAKAKAEKRWKEVQENVARELAEAKNAKYKKPERPPVERKPNKKGPKFFTGLFITFDGNK